MRSFILACLLLMPVATFAAPAKTTPMPAYLHLACVRQNLDGPPTVDERYIAVESITRFFNQPSPPRTIIQTLKGGDECAIYMPFEDFKAALKDRGIVIYETPFYFP